MEEFLTGLVLPFTAVSMTIVGLTLALFNVPMAEPKPRVVSSVNVAPSPVSSRPRALTVGDAFAHALSALNRTRPAGLGPSPSSTSTVTLAVAKVGEATPPGSPLPPPSTPVPDTSLLTAVSALGDAVKAIRDARTEEDIVHAEEQMRTAREQMEATCTGAGGPLCDSAREVRSLGY